jgi:hypothetical protein
MLTAVDSSHTVIRWFSCTNVSTVAIFSSVMTDTCPGHGWSAVDTRPPQNSTHNLNTVLLLDMRPHTRPSFDAKCHLATRRPCTGIEWRCVVLAWTHPFDTLAATSSTTTQHTCRRLTLFYAGTANSLLCTPANTWPPCQLLALLQHVSVFHLNNPYIKWGSHTQ